jgi:FlaA1/EpsC-like NDP-sugar epimerase
MTSSETTLAPGPALSTPVDVHLLDSHWDRFTTGVRRYAGIGLTDAGAVALSYILVLFLRMEGHIPHESLVWLAAALPFLAALYVAANMVGGAYWRNWRYATIDDAASLLRPVAATALLLTALSALLSAGRPLPLSVYLTASLLAYLGMVTARLFPHRWGRLLRASADPRERVLVVGSGRAAHDLVRHLLYYGHGYLPVAVVTDDPLAARLNIHGVRSIGRVADLPQLIEEHHIDVVAIAMPEAPRADMRRIVDQCLTTNARIRIAPDFDHVLAGTAGPEELLRAPVVEDFLGRQPASADLESCRSYIADRRVLITGAAGSIGSELARQVRRLGPAHLFLLDLNESGLFDLEQELRDEAFDTPISLLVRNIEDQRAVDATFALDIDLVFHAAAYKHVSLMEDQPDQAIVTNVFGTRRLVLAARAAGVERFVFISSDKAVNPSNVMGATKRIGEAIVHGLSGPAMQTAAVRFGNVLGSRGSVLPIFERQIRRGGPLTVSHPDVRRFFMTIPEAVMLVIQAGALTTGRDTFVLRMGEDVRILDLAQKLIRLRGHRVGDDIDIVIRGLQPGEKLAEELAYDHETLSDTPHPDVFRIAGPPLSAAATIEILEALEAAVALLPSADLRPALLRAVDTLIDGPAVPTLPLPDNVVSAEAPAALP